MKFRTKPCEIEAVQWTAAVVRRKSKASVMI